MHEKYFLKLIDEGVLEVDASGRIWRKRRWGRRVSPRRAEYLLPTGYLHINVKVNRKNIKVRAHRLVWTYFNGSIPKDKQINHKNGVKDDNRPGNLEVVTQSQNAIHASRVLGVNNRRGEKNSNAILTEADVRRIKQRLFIGEMCRTIAMDFPVTEASISEIKLGKTWAHVS